MKLVVGAVLVCLVVAVLAISFRRLASSSESESPDVFMAALAAETVDFAGEEFSITLDYSLESIQDVETILGKLHEKYSGVEDSQGMHSYALGFGAYIGEVLKRHFARGHWEKDHPIGGELSWPFVWEDGDHVSFPYGWCGKRIQNGPEDNVWFRGRTGRSGRRRAKG